MATPTHTTFAPVIRSRYAFQKQVPLHKCYLGTFLAQNPFPEPLTQGFFYREKMRAIHRITPDCPFQHILEVGGGQSGLTSMLFPTAEITNIDINPDYSGAPCNQLSRVTFICGDATQLPFDDQTFDAITMFDLLEHVAHDYAAIDEALRVLRPGGYLLISTPNEYWRFPYYRIMRDFCPQEFEIMAEWGHVRRGYSLESLAKKIPLPCQGYATFINPLTVLSHDIAFSNLSRRKRKLLCSLLSPIAWVSYWSHRPTDKGTETASVWYKPL